MEITDKIHLLKIDFDIVAGPGKIIPRFVNVIIIFGKKITLIDTGVKNSEGKIAGYFESNNRHLSELETIILSHSHPDHIGSASLLKRKTGCRVLAHKNEVAWMRDPKLQNRERPVPGFFNLVDEGVDPDGLLTGGAIFQADENITIEIIHSPGHSPGSLNLLFREDRIMFTADSVPVMNDIPNYHNAGELLQSLEKIKTEKRYDLLLTSWTPPLKSKDEINRMIADGESYIRKIGDIVKNTYRGDEPGPLAFCTEAVMELGLPAFLSTPVVDKALRSHLTTGLKN